MTHQQTLLHFVCAFAFAGPLKRCNVTGNKLVATAHPLIPLQHNMQHHGAHMQEPMHSSATASLAASGPDHIHSGASGQLALSSSTPQHQPMQQAPSQQPQPLLPQHIQQQQQRLLTRAQASSLQLPLQPQQQHITFAMAPVILQLSSLPQRQGQQQQLVAPSCSTTLMSLAAAKADAVAPVLAAVPPSRPSATQAEHRSQPDLVATAGTNAGHQPQQQVQLSCA